ncbi:Gfo/Idh/MocA family oxidoreductase [Parasalinivibrio latis]|uniref:Gfo/Idh/MocA family protein n=1 Tax=Parasalinivibrio latis TaxID=2952610 RepID=UPI0030DE4134
MQKVAVIGLGNIATRHRKNLKLLLPGVTVYAMSASGRIPEEMVSDCDVLVASVAELIFEQIDMVIVASPAPFHCRHAIPLIEAGVPVLIEKPVTTALQDAELIQEAAKKYMTPVAVGYCLRYLSSAIEVKRFIECGKLGQLYHASVEIGQYLPDWRPSKDYRDSVSASAHLGGGALLELSHELDYTQWLLGPLTLQHAVLRTSQELGLEVEDSADILVTACEGSVVNIHLDFLQRKAYRYCRFVGSSGALEWDLIQNEVTFKTKSGANVVYSNPGWDKNQMYLNMLKDFILMIDRKENQSVSVDEAKKTVSLIEKIKSSSSRFYH